VGLASVVVGVGVGHWNVRSGVLRSIRHLAAASQLSEMLSRKHGRGDSANNMCTVVCGGVYSDSNAIRRRVMVRLGCCVVFIANSS
jgi:hypothetical protein